MPIPALELAGTLGTGKSESVKHLGFDIPDFGTLGTGVFIPQSGFDFNEERRKKRYIGTKIPVPSVPSVPNSSKVVCLHLWMVLPLDYIRRSSHTLNPAAWQFIAWAECRHVLAFKHFLQFLNHLFLVSSIVPYLKVFGILELTFTQ